MLRFVLAFVDAVAVMCARYHPFPKLVKPTPEFLSELPSSPVDRLNQNLGLSPDSLQILPFNCKNAQSTPFDFRKTLKV